MVEAEGWNKNKPHRSGSGVQISKWNTIPAQMFRYRSAVFLARAYCPEVTFGFPTVQELRDIGETERKRPVSPLEEKLSPKPVESKVVEESTETEKPKKIKKATTRKKPEPQPEPTQEEPETASDKGEANVEVRFFCPDCDHEHFEAKEKGGLFQCKKCLKWNVVDRHSKEEPTE